MSFYRFPPEGTERRERWIRAIRRENWTPGKHDRLCSQHFVSGAKSDDPLSPDYVPTIFRFMKSPKKRKQSRALLAYERRTIDEAYAL